MTIRRFALDQNFPTSIVGVLSNSIVESELVSVRDIDRRLSTLDDWELLLALHHHPTSWDGMITTDSNMITLPRELAIMSQLRLTLVITEAAGHDPILATGMVLTSLPKVCELIDPAKPQIFRLRAPAVRSETPHFHVDRVARHRSENAGDMIRKYRLSAEELQRDPLKQE